MASKHSTLSDVPRGGEHAAAVRPLRLGFAGVGWIGRHRMEAVARRANVRVAAVADPSEEARGAAGAVAPDAALMADFDDLLEEDLDAVVIATPSALHCEQAIAALEKGLAVFCQKPLARTAADTRRVVQAARSSDRLLGVDFCYRQVRGVPEMRRLIRGGELGHVYAADLTFHNAYGPDKSWFYDSRQSGGGCLMDLGIHLVDLALWMWDFPEVAQARGKRFSGGSLLTPGSETTEDYAVAELETCRGELARLACSWNLSAGRDAVIEAAFYGTQGGVALRNVNGSFYDFIVERFDGTASTVLAGPPDCWGERSIEAWAERLAVSCHYDPQADHLAEVAEALDRIYERCAY